MYNNLVEFQCLLGPVQQQSLPVATDAAKTRAYKQETDRDFPPESLELHLHTQSQTDPISARSQSSIDPLASHFTASVLHLWPHPFPFTMDPVRFGPRTAPPQPQPPPPPRPESSSVPPVRRRSPSSHMEVDCLMLWKLTREGEVGMDMAWVIRARMECCSCHRWKRFLTAERTCQTGDGSVSASSSLICHIYIFLDHILQRTFYHNRSHK